MQPVAAIVKMGVTKRGKMGDWIVAANHVLREKNKTTMLLMRGLNSFKLLVVLAALVFVVASTIEFYSINSLPVNEGQLLSLRVGTTQDSVAKIFGSPYEILDLYGDVAWKYYRKPRKKMVYIIFDDQKKYKNYEIDD